MPKLSTKPKRKPQHRQSKPRSDSRLLNLPADQESLLIDQLIAGMGYIDAQAMMRARFQIEVSIPAYATFWKRKCIPVIDARAVSASQTSQAHNAALEANRADWDTILMAKVKERAFRMAMDPGADPEALDYVVGLVLKARDQELKQEQLKLTRDKFEFDAAAAALKEVEKLKFISQNQSLNERQKMDAVRLVLFGDPGEFEAIYQPTQPPKNECHYGLNGGGVAHKSGG
ncbi:MAG: hypothetical protein ACAI35_04410 [Candidatus Methylacidiphilales bacterium]|nr:hypothetical protein [Candidatus Methylacidiphilales bacterium]